MFRQAKWRLSEVGTLGTYIAAVAVAKHMCRSGMGMEMGTGNGNTAHTVIIEVRAAFGFFLLDLRGSWHTWYL
ncbi:hypothetical protein EDD36DRAFT_7178 [Exophiala viscosa]|uniref:Uncharacterized protein n=1 Tax=Exophiala viscosa TaxID=2486360 RepID=A0AAN6E5L3_9EURO|nr:hypothetical protein EDD36DRAFT_7178 [Exophiala viscosa]